MRHTTSGVELASLATSVNKSRTLQKLFKCFEEKNRQRKVIMFFLYLKIEKKQKVVVFEQRARVVPSRFKA